MFAVSGTITETHGFTGKEWDADLQLYYYNARWYEPTTGRFVSVDPVRQGINWYVYCRNNPLAFLDPTGRQYTAPWEDIYSGKYDPKPEPVIDPDIANDNLPINWKKWAGFPHNNKWYDYQGNFIYDEETRKKWSEWYGGIPKYVPIYDVARLKNDLKRLGIYLGKEDNEVIVENTLSDEEYIAAVYNNQLDLGLLAQSSYPDIIYDNDVYINQCLKTIFESEMIKYVNKYRNADFVGPAPVIGSVNYTALATYKNGQPHLTTPGNIAVDIAGGGRPVYTTSTQTFVPGSRRDIQTGYGLHFVSYGQEQYYINAHFQRNTEVDRDLKNLLGIASAAGVKSFTLPMGLQIGVTGETGSARGPHLHYETGTSNPYPRSLNFN